MASRPYRIPLKLKKYTICSIYNMTLINDKFFTYTKAEDDD